MAFIDLSYVSKPLLPDILSLDRLCFGGLWNESGYLREIESPNSDLIIATHSPLPVVAPDSPQRPLSKSNSDEAEVAAVGISNGVSQADTVLGMGCAWAIVDEAHITLLAVRPEVRRQGLGKLLLYALLRCAHQRGMKRATLEVRASNSGAIALYDTFGFSIAGTRKRYYQDTGEDALILWQSGMQTPTFAASLQQWKNDIDNTLAQHRWRINQDLL